MEVTSKAPKFTGDYQHDPNYLALSRMLVRYQNLILLVPTPNEALDTRLKPWQTKVQTELWSSLPFHRTKWLRNIEGARSLLLKLEQSALGIKVQRTKREVIKDLAQKRSIIKRLRSRVEEIGREMDASARTNQSRPDVAAEDDSESMLDVLQQIRKAKLQGKVEHTEQEHLDDREPKNAQFTESGDLRPADDISFDASSGVRRRQIGVSETADTTVQQSDIPFNHTKGRSDLEPAMEHENITTSLLTMAAELKQRARQFQFSLQQDEDLLGRVTEGLDKNVSAMGIASKGMKTLQRMSEEQGFWGRLKLQLLISGLWLVAILLVFVGPKLRF